MFFKKISGLFIILIMFLFVGCSQQFREIPSGRIGKILTSNGFEKTWRTPGMVDIGQERMSGLGNRLITLEVTSVAIKESFSKNQGGDHRIRTGDKVPLDVDVYFRLIIPEEEIQRNNILAQVTPVNKGNRYFDVSVHTIYNHFAKMDLRANTREIFTKYKDDNAVMTNLEKINTQIFNTCTKTLKENNVPLILQNARVSNIKPDETLNEAKNKQAAALARVAEIDSIGRALKRNPDYLIWQQIEMYKEIGKSNSNATFIIGNVPTVVGRK